MLAPGNKGTDGSHDKSPAVFPSERGQAGGKLYLTESAIGDIHSASVVASTTRFHLFFTFLQYFFYNGLTLTDQSSLPRERK